MITMNVPGGFPAGGAATNEARVTSTTTDPDPTDDTAEFTTTGNTAADLRVTKTATPDPVVAGESVTWTITVFNDGPSAAAGVTVTDDLPAGLENVVVPAGCTGTATVTCTIGTIAPGASATVTITADVLPGGEAGPRLVNTATATSTTPDPTASNNTATSTTAVELDADISIVKTVTPDPSPAGSMVEFSITVTNNGPSTARDVVFVDRFTGDPFLQAIIPGCTVVSIDELECEVGDLAPGEDATVTFLASFPAAGTYTNSVQASTATPETDLSNNADAVDINATDPDVDLVLTKTGPATVLAGGRFEYQLTLVNTGTSVALDAPLTDTLPVGLVPESAQGDFVTCTISWPDGQLQRPVRGAR